MMESKSSSVTSVSIFHNIGTTSQKIAIVITTRHTKPDHTLSQTICREIPNVVVNTPASYAGGPGFKSRPADRLFWLRFLVVFLSPYRQMPE
jgi:hypothetical protein